MSGLPYEVSRNLNLTSVLSIQHEVADFDFEKQAFCRAQMVTSSPRESAYFGKNLDLRICIGIHVYINICLGRGTKIL